MSEKQSLEKKPKFDHFKFLYDRETSIPVTQEDFDIFGNYMTCLSMSMNKNYLDYIPSLNSMAFSKLSKKHQCIAYTTFNGSGFPRVPWLKSSKKDKEISKEIIVKICKLFSCSVREAKMYIGDDYFDINTALDLYADRYERDSLISSKTGNIKKR